ncbi:hypothetical protein T484DRAFT_1797869 [Baffinella frigidus]|nr:hypothetical protein T484DRAFT_1797869 [Cryptophyta sp. CCMP2293]
MTVRYHTEAITARPGEHYSSVSGDLNWLEGDVSTRTITVPIKDNSAYDPTVASRTFRVVLQNVTFSNGTVTTDMAYKGPERISAIVEVEEQDGPGVLSFKGNLSEAVMMLTEDVGAVTLRVSRRAGAQFSVSVGYSTVAGNATTPLLVQVSEGVYSAAVFPTSCAGATASGVLTIQTLLGEVREVYCSVTASVASASMLLMPDSATLSPLWERACFDASRGDIQGAFLSADFSAHVAHGPTPPSNTTEYSTLSTRGSPMHLADLPGRPAGVGAAARPVPFPVNNRTVWFDRESTAVFWAQGSGRLS